MSRRERRAVLRKLRAARAEGADLLNRTVDPELQARLAWRLHQLDGIIDEIAQGRS